MRIFALIAFMLFTSLVPHCVARDWGNQFAPGFDPGRPARRYSDIIWWANQQPGYSNCSASILAAVDQATADGFKARFVVLWTKPGRRGGHGVPAIKIGHKWCMFEYKVYTRERHEWEMFAPQPFKYAKRYWRDYPPTHSRWYRPMRNLDIKEVVILTPDDPWLEEFRATPRYQKFLARLKRGHPKLFN